MAWERVQPRSGIMSGPRARVRMGVERSGPRPSDKTGVRFSISADIGRQLGWDRNTRIVLERDRDARKMRISWSDPNSPADETYKLTGTTATSHTLTFRVALASLRIFSERPMSSMEPVEHVLEDGAIIITPPAWAWDDYDPPPAAAEVSSAPTPLHRVDAPRALVSLPLPMIRGFVAPKVTLEEQLEAETKLRAGEGAKALADWFGWPLPWAQDYARAFRAAQDAIAGRAA